MHLRFIKKVLEDGSVCKKCQEVSERLVEDGIMPLIDEVMIADSRDKNSPGIQLAKQYRVGRAPFFLLKTEQETLVFDVYFKLRKHLIDQGVIAARERTL